MIGLRSTWAKAKTWISSKLSYIIEDAPELEAVEPLEAVEAVEEADEFSRQPSFNSRSLQATMLKRDRRREAVEVPESVQ